MAYQSTRTGSQVDSALDNADTAVQPSSINTLAGLNSLITDATLLSSSAFATVATSGNYSDLIGTPSIPSTLAALDTSVTGGELNLMKSKLDLIEDGATGDQTGTQIADLLDTGFGHSNWKRNIGTTAGTVAAGDDARFLSVAQKTDLTDGANSAAHYHDSDRNRANHTGTQAISTVSGLQDTLDGKLEDTHESTYDHSLIGTSVQPGDDLSVLGSGTATDGQVPTANGTGGIVWEDQTGDGSATGDGFFDLILPTRNSVGFDGLIFGGRT
jgi:hypothetical protein